MKAFRLLCTVISIASLAACLWFSWTVFAADTGAGPDFDKFLTKLGIASLVWFATAPFWMTPELFRKNGKPDAE